MSICKSQERAGHILTALQSNIEQDVPAIVRQQEKIRAAVEQAVLQPMEDAAWTGRRIPQEGLQQRCRD